MRSYYDIAWGLKYKQLENQHYFSWFERFDNGFMHSRFYDFRDKSARLFNLDIFKPTRYHVLFKNNRDRIRINLSKRV